MAPYDPYNQAFLADTETQPHAVEAAQHRTSAGIDLNNWDGPGWMNRPWPKDMLSTTKNENHREQKPCAEPHHPTSKPDLCAACHLKKQPSVSGKDSPIHAPPPHSVVDKCCGNLCPDIEMPPEPRPRHHVRRCSHLREEQHVPLVRQPEKRPSKGNVAHGDRLFGNPTCQFRHVQTDPPTPVPRYNNMSAGHASDFPYTHFDSKPLHSQPVVDSSNTSSPASVESVHSDPIMIPHSPSSRHRTFWSGTFSGYEEDGHGAFTASFKREPPSFIPQLSLADENDEEDLIIGEMEMDGFQPIFKTASRRKAELLRPRWVSTKSW